MKRFLTIALAAGLVTFSAAPAFPVGDGWGPTGRASIIRTGAHVISRDLGVPLNRFDDYVRRGALLDEETLDEYFPNRHMDPLGTIRKQIYLLQAVRSERLDPYYAFRLGALGTIVADVTAPMQTAAPGIREAYFRDAEDFISNAQIVSLARDIVDATYFPEQIRDASSQDETIEADYRAGLGFQGIARQTLADDASRSVDAVADVFYTIIVEDVSNLNVSQSDMRAYALDALAFYLDDENLGEAEAAYEKVIALGVLTPELERQIGDVYFDAGYFSRAIVHYESVLQRDPSRRDVALRVAKYYEAMGDDAREAGMLEDALAAYERAVDVDSLLENPHRKMLQTRRAISAREARHEAARTALDLASDYVAESESKMRQRDYLGAMASLREAQAHYRSVTDEFEDEFREATRGMRQLEMLLKEVKDQLARDVQRYSGTGFPFEARILADRLPGVEQETFDALAVIELNAAMDDLADSVSQQLVP